MRSISSVSLALALICMACTNKPDPAVENSAARPNIIMIVADDLGYHDIGAFGNTTIKTPHLDRLAGQGLRFTDFHSNGAVCSPTRAALMTGRYQQRSGIEGVVTARSHRDTGLDTAETTLADFLKTQQYRTAIAGKWHLGYDTLYSPLNHGFDYFKGFVSGNIDYHSHIDQEGYFDWWLGKDTLVEEGYSTDLITRAAIDFMTDNKDNPFFLYIAHEAPHYPYQGRHDKADRSLDGEFEVQGSRTDRQSAYREMIQAMDEGIGTILSYLEEQTLLPNTLILFFSDNGAAAVGSNDPLRGNKGSLWEGGHRVPAIAFWEGRIKAGLVDEPLMTMDVFPTMVQLLDRQADQYALDGRSFLPWLIPDEAQKEPGPRPLFWKFKGRKAVRLGDWKLVMNRDSSYLFNLHDDLAEQHNRIAEHPGLTDSLSHLLQQWEVELARYELRTE